MKFFNISHIFHVTLRKRKPLEICNKDFQTSSRQSKNACYDQESNHILRVASLALQLYRFLTIHLFSFAQIKNFAPDRLELVACLHSKE